MRTPTKIAFAGDWHGNAFWATEMIKSCKINGVDTIVHAGDFGYKFDKNFMHKLRLALEDADINLYFVDGNHDEHPQIWKWDLNDDGFLNPKSGRFVNRVNYIPRGHRWEWWGMTWMGLGGAHSVDRPWRTPGQSWWSTELIRPRDVDAAEKGGKVDILITHDVPANFPLPNERKSRGNSDYPEAELISAEGNRRMLQMVVDKVEPKLIVHGHFHERRDEVHHGTRIVGLDMDASSWTRNIWMVENTPLDTWPVWARIPRISPFKSARIPEPYRDEDLDDNF